MKINVTYEATDIEKLVRQDLIRQNLDTSAASICLENNEVHVTISGVVPDEPPAQVPSAPTPDAAPATPPLAVVEGGNQPVDMSDVFAASANVAAGKKPLYPTTERQLIEGESYEYPGTPTR